MIQLGNVEVILQPPEDWEYSAESLELKSFVFSIKSERFSFFHEVSFEGGDSPMVFFEKLAERSHDDLHWQSLCQEVFLKSKYSDDTFYVQILAHNDSDDHASGCSLELSLSLDPEEISIDIPKLKRIFNRIRSV